MGHLGTHKNTMPEDGAAEEASRAYGAGEGIPGGMEVHGHRARYQLRPVDVPAIGATPFLALWCLLLLGWVSIFCKSRHALSSSQYFCKIFQHQG